MQAQGRHPHGADAVGRAGHQVGVSPYGGGRGDQGHVGVEGGGRVGKGQPGVGEGQAGEGFGLARGVENVGCLWGPGAGRKGAACGAQGAAG